MIEPAKRTGNVQEYYFSRKLKEVASLNAARAAGGDEPIINLGIGAPDRLPPKAALGTLADQAGREGVHAYQSYNGIPALRQAFANWYARYYGVTLDAETEIQPLFGSKEGILILSLAYLNKGDKVLAPDPGYPTYSSASRLAEAEIIYYDLNKENGFLPDFEALEKSDLSGVKIMWTNYPNMPTGGAATMELYERLVEFGRKHNILICNDNPYSFILTEKPLSILSVPGAKECCVELNSLSKAHNMSGWRIGMIAADKGVVEQFLKVKSQMDSGMFLPMQLAAVQALNSGPEWFEQLNAEYRLRRVAAGRIFRLIGAEYNPDAAGLFLWGRVTADNPLAAAYESHAAGDKAGAECGGAAVATDGKKTGEAAECGKTLGERVSDAALYGAGVFITPGLIFGHNGNDYVRISLCATQETLGKAYDRLAALMAGK